MKIGFDFHNIKYYGVLDALTPSPYRELMTKSSLQAKFHAGSI